MVDNYLKNWFIVILVGIFTSAKFLQICLKSVFLGCILTKCWTAYLNKIQIKEILCWLSDDSFVYSFNEYLENIQEKYLALVRVRNIRRYSKNISKISSTYIRKVKNLVCKYFNMRQIGALLSEIFYCQNILKTIWPSSAIYIKSHIYPVESVKGEGFIEW